MLFAFDHLYMCAQNRVVRVPVSPDGEFGEMENSSIKARVEHGPHSLIVTEDGRGCIWLLEISVKIHLLKSREFEPIGKTMYFWKTMPMGTMETVKHRVDGC